MEKHTDHRMAAAVLTGGRSIRMGTPKETMIIPGDGRTFLERICDEVDITYPDTISGRYLSVRADQETCRSGYVRVPDRYDGAGPLGGIASVLMRARDDGFDAVLMLACDMIRYDHGEIESVCGNYHGEDILFVRTGPDDLQPLASIYSTGVAEDVRAQIESGDLRIRNLRDRGLGVHYFDSSDPGLYENRNTPF